MKVTTVKEGRVSSLNNLRPRNETIVLSVSNKGFAMSKLKRLYLTAAAGVLLVFYFSIWKSSTFEGINNTVTVISSQPVEQVVNETLFNNTGALCQLKYEDNRHLNVAGDVSVIYFITPTYSRPVQMAELLRLGQTLLHVPSIHWIVVEDAENCSPLITSFLDRLGIPYTHMINPMPPVFRKESILPRGVSNRRAALSWIRSSVDKGVVYFGDDDNTFDLRLFDEIRNTKRVSMLPVGLIGEYGVSSPVVENGHVVGFFDPWPAGRQFPVDMAGFAVNVRLLHKYPNATIPYKAGHEEDLFLRALGLQMDDIEPKAKNCSEILVWHTRTVQVKASSLRLPSDKKAAGLLRPLFDVMTELGLATFSTKGLKTAPSVILN